MNRTLIRRKKRLRANAKHISVVLGAERAYAQWTPIWAAHVKRYGSDDESKWKAQYIRHCDRGARREHSSARARRMHRAMITFYAVLIVAFQGYLIFRLPVKRVDMMPTIDSLFFGGVSFSLIMLTLPRRPPERFWGGMLLLGLGLQLASIGLHFLNPPIVGFTWSTSEHWWTTDNWYGRIGVTAYFYSFLGYIGLMGLSLSWIHRTFGRTRRSSAIKEPHLTAIWALADLIGALTEPDTYFVRRHSFLQRRILDCIEVTALAIELGLCESAQDLSGPVSESVAERFYRAAAAVRDLKVLVIFAQIGTREALLEQASDLAVTFITRDFHYLPLSNEIPPPKVIESRVARTARRIGSMVAPIAFVTTWTTLGLPLPTPLRESLFGFAAIWLLVGVISLVDSNYGSTLTKVQDTLSAVKDTGSKE